MRRRWVVYGLYVVLVACGGAVLGCADDDDAGNVPDPGNNSTNNQTSNNTSGTNNATNNTTTGTVYDPEPHSGAPWSICSKFFNDEGEYVSDCPLESPEGQPMRCDESAGDQSAEDEYTGRCVASCELSDADCNHGLGTCNVATPNGNLNPVGVCSYPGWPAYETRPRCETDADCQRSTVAPGSKCEDMLDDGVKTCAPVTCNRNNPCPEGKECRHWDRPGSVWSVCQDPL